MERYSRQILLPEIGEKGQRRLRDAAVLIVGLGGLGSPVSLSLGGAGVGRLGLCDRDVVSLSNLHRQLLYRESWVGRPKAAMAAERLRELNSEVAYELYTEGLTEENAEAVIGRYDLVVDCTDNFATRYLIDRTCLRLSKPWIFGSIGPCNGLVSTFLPGKKRFSDLFPDDGELSARPAAAAGVIAPVPFVVGALQALEVMKLICGFGELLSERLLEINLFTLQINVLDI